MEKLTRFEITRLISARALQIALGAPSLIKVEKEETPLEIAKKELDEKLLPLSVLRVYPNGEVERLEIG